MNNAPQLPAEISNDGHEVWDWADSFSKHVHRMDAIRQTKAALARNGRRCGDCDNWMKSRQCPQERNVNGYNRGPSCEGVICQNFVLSSVAASRRAELTEKLSVLEAST